MTLHPDSAWLLLLLLGLPLIAWWRRRRPRPGLLSSSTALAAGLRPTLAVRLRWLPNALRLVTLGLLVVALARPVQLDDRARVFTEGVAIQLLVDRSGSMRAEDFILGGRPVSRLEAVKAVVRSFVAGGDDLPGRPSDLIGVVSFASYPESICPLTLDHDHLLRTIRTLDVASELEGAETAIGDAIGLAVERLRSLEERLRLDPDRVIRSKVIVLLTDGEQTFGAFDPVTAAELAAVFDIKVYAIGVGGSPGMRGGVDVPTLRTIAERTGGRFFRADDTTALVDVYATIDELERTEIEQQRFETYREAVVAPIDVGPVTLPPVAAVILVLLVTEILLRALWLETVP